MDDVRILTGSYTIPSEWTGTPYGHGAGIVAGELSSSGLVLDATGVAEVNPSFVVADAVAGLVWAITEPEKGGEVLAFRAGAGGVIVGEPTRVATGCDAPCHLTLTPALALVSHYHGGAVSVVGRDPDGLPERVLAIVEPPATGPGWDRSAEPSRPHSTLWGPGEDHFLVADCGRDTVLLYRWDGAALAAELVDTLLLPEGTGPRHLARHAASGAVLVSAQNSGSVAVVGVVGGRLELRQLVEIPGLGRRRVVPSEIAVHPSGSSAVVANRWDDSLTVMAIAESGELSVSTSVDAGGVNPRHFAISPDGGRLLVALQESDGVAVFDVAGDELRLLSVEPASTPTCIAYWPDRISDRRA